MGGFGRGTWERTDTRATVERSLVVAVGEFRKRLFKGAN
jgi:hypothetical protein